MLAVQQLEAGYGESVILRGVTLQVRPGQVVCLLGRNGVGKTTLMKSIMGVIKARKGTVAYKGSDLTKRAPGQRAKKGIGYVPQGREVFAQLTVFENVLLGLEASTAKRKTIPESAIAKFPVLQAMYGRRGGDLSGGQQQQLAFARALASEPDLLLLDEPCEGIQPSIVDDIRDVIRSIKADGKTAILLVEQSLEFVKSVGDYFYILEKGAVAWEGSLGDLNDEVIRHYLTV
ncbi:urea ABC transporter ATP-binding subunit UrtE [Paenibacillus sacheonensis]|uniref:Urea ABC transporter ATP-binding subunit UrtE n=1 Tax=Paenibacillus sacheonensis TaxID=742054 RepID=A0A7X4YVQ4_9BACL|nr:urea ABC transporter ATP-binding subunit UrtE [Paenibacillus sacheonensis]MBM7569326.1 urea transport system ATP-binding protein [Paenibacillus sacheonensis]NBC73318.1 urea ABC transporter ATP-binding subunit UrtE [Paenibacillus sacheonensis]